VNSHRFFAGDPNTVDRSCRLDPCIRQGLAPFPRDQQGKLFVSPVQQLRQTRKDRLSLVCGEAGTIPPESRDGRIDRAFHSSRVELFDLGYDLAGVGRMHLRAELRACMIGYVEYVLFVWHRFLGDVQGLISSPKRWVSLMFSL
jgi:hypothetical protein